MADRPGERIRVVAVDDDAPYRVSLDVLFRHSREFVLVDAFRTPAAALEALDGGGFRGSISPWDLVLMDLGLPGMSRAECTRRIKAVVQGTMVVALTVFEDRASIFEAICAGADGYLLKRTPEDQFLLQLRAALLFTGWGLSRPAAEPDDDLPLAQPTTSARRPARWWTES